MSQQSILFKVAFSCQQQSTVSVWDFHCNSCFINMARSVSVWVAVLLWAKGMGVRSQLEKKVINIVEQGRKVETMSLGLMFESLLYPYWCMWLVVITSVDWMLWQKERRYPEGQRSPLFCRRQQRTAWVLLCWVKRANSSGSKTVRQRQLLGDKSPEIHSLASLSGKAPSC